MTTTTSTEPVCARIARRLAQSVGPQRYGMWFSQAARLNWDDGEGRLQVVVPNRFIADWISRNFEPHLRDAARGELGQDVPLAVCVDPDSFPSGDQAATAPAPPAGPAAARPATLPPAGRPLPPSLRYRLDDFVVGPSNELAFAAAQRLAGDSDAALSVSPLFVHGGVGLGKTHLLQGICRRMLELRPDARVLYATGEQFTNEFLTAVRSGSIDPFRRRIRKLDLLAVDDVHFIANKQATQQEFLHSFNAIELSGARVVLASDCHPRMIQQFSEALVSRCVRGMVVEVKAPDTATRVRIVRALAERRGISLLESVVAVLAGQCTGSVRELEGTLAKLQALAALRETPAAGSAAGSPAAPAGPLGHAAVNQLLALEAAETPRRPVRFDAILRVVCERLGMTRDQVLRGDRHRLSVLARGLAVRLARTMTPMSYPEIAAALARTSHSTVLCADRRMQEHAAGNRALVLANPATGLIEQVDVAHLLAELRHALQRA